MRVDALISLLQDWQKRHGPGAQIAVPSQKLGDGDYGCQNCREEVYIHNEPIATILTSRGEVVGW